MERLLAQLGYPQSHLPPVIHVAGTNGKGSVIAFLEAALRSSGKRVHTYTSPHLVHFHERIRLSEENGKISPISEIELQHHLARCESINQGLPITLFEITTAAAILAFAKHPADFLLLEVGLGGRLDATNILEAPLMSVITPISMDHTQFLGNTLRSIAMEKSGILKPNIPAVIAPQFQVVSEVITSTAIRVGSPLFRHGFEWCFKTQSANRKLMLHLNDKWLDLETPSLLGQHQLSNAATAAVTLLSLPKQSVGPPHVRNGLKTAIWPGRLQRIELSSLNLLVPESAEIWVDGGHNPAAGKALAETLSDWRAKELNAIPVYLIVGMLISKDINSYLSAFKKNQIVERVYGVAIHGEHFSRSGQSIAESAKAVGIKSQAISTLEDGLLHIASTNKVNPVRIVICGSLYLAGQVLRYLERC